MNWEFIVVLVIAIPIITFPAVFVWYVNGADLYHAFRDRVATRRKKTR